MIARCENVVAKLGGLAMPDNGFGWHSRATPATSDAVLWNALKKMVADLSADEKGALPQGTASRVYRT